MYLIGSTHTVAFAIDCQIEIFNGRDPCRQKQQQQNEESTSGTHDFLVGLLKCLSYMDLYH
jgi:hypothetical protein